MPLLLPEGKTLAVNVGADFDAHSLWMGSFARTGPGYLSRGEFGAEVGVPRLLALFERYGVRGTWCTPGHTMATFPAALASIIEAGHEVAAHGCYHEVVTSLDADTERRLMERQLAQHERYVGRRPRGYRSPSWDFTDATLGLLEEYGFDWDSSLMGRDFTPYHPRQVTVGWEEGSTFGPPSRILEIPVSWFLDDFPAAEYVPRLNTGFTDPAVLLQRWLDHLDYACAHATGGCLALTVHPQTIGRAHLIGVLERFLDHAAARPGVWFATLSEIGDAWREG